VPTINLLSVDAQGTLIASASTINEGATHVMGIFAARVAEIFWLFFLALVFAIIPTLSISIVKRLVKSITVADCYLIGTI
jgi:hypothetical protein